MRRCAVSIPSNIAEGQARRSAKEFSRFLNIARGSLAELDAQCILAEELGLADPAKSREIRSAIDELQRMLYALVQKIGTDNSEIE
ncbi:four helix bundle protein [Candidatus Sumerlaeota bacterium]|nr:four helix bundle protein [Candidatus Sumerlaeota bacterium]